MAHQFSIEAARRGGQTRARRMTAEERSEAARHAARCRFGEVRTAARKESKFAMSLPAIAQVLGISRDTVRRDLERGLIKIGALRLYGSIEDFERMLRPLIGCGSVECRGDWIRTFGEDVEA